MHTKRVLGLGLGMVGAILLGNMSTAQATPPVAGGSVITWGMAGAGFNTNTPVAATSGVSAVAAGSAYYLALKNGQVLAWGGNLDGVTNVPASATSGVTAVAASAYHSMALVNGGVVSWGRNTSGQTNVPAEASSGVTAIASGPDYGMALKDGQVIIWGAPPLNMPATATSGVSAIAAGGTHALVLKNGQVIAWGNATDGKTNVPAEALSGVTAIAAGGYHSLALKNGKVIAWGLNTSGQCTVPAEALSGVTAIAASGGTDASMALKNGRVLVWGDNAGGATNVSKALSWVVSLACGRYTCAAVNVNYARLYWQHPAGTVAEWTLDTQGSAVCSRVLTTVGSDWKLKAVADITGDGVEDLLWQRSSDGGLAAWCMNLDGSAQGVYAWGNQGLWELKSCGNINADTQTEFFFQKPTGEVAFWTVATNGTANGVKVLGSQYPWKLNGVGDLTQDGLAELFWQAPAGTTVAWVPTSPWLPPFTSAPAFTTLALGTPAGWELRGTADLDGDGIADLLWQTPSGLAACWLMNSNGTARSTLPLGTAGTWRLCGASSKH